MNRLPFLLLLLFTLSSLQTGPAFADEPADHVAQLQAEAFEKERSALGHWGTVPEKYSQWKTHSNRLIPVYTFGTKDAGEGIDLNGYTGRNSAYRSESEVRKLYSRVPERTVDPEAVWMDQTDIAAIQRSAAAAGRKYIFLVVFDGMDWDTTRAAAIYNQKAVTYSEGKGSGTHFQTYSADGTSQFGFMVTSPHNDGTKTNVDQQTVNNPGGTSFGGYDASSGGRAPWTDPSDISYLIAKPSEGHPKHAYTDSASSATSMMSGHKTYNGAINVGPSGERLSTVAHELQEKGRAVGIVTSVPICHATPACAYAHNVSRKDYQDISRDMLGLPSIAHPEQPLPGLDVVLGCGYGKDVDDTKTQGENYVPGNIYLTQQDLEKVSVKNGGQYVTTVRKENTSGAKRLRRAAAKAAENGHRLLGFYGMGRYNGHLPFQTANGDFAPVRGVARNAENYSEQEVRENPTLAQMTEAAIKVLSTRREGFWLLVEAGDVDWANHDNNIDNSIGAVNSGEAAVMAITDWVEQNSNWQESVLIVTADHGHLFQLKSPQLLAEGR